ncbi:MAG: hypothetical protein O9286_11965 [Aquidulcibacter sp.]|uniref:hypothetical protein n=1 Tax=Aquidulcibacter sp. TaxID=2052990 RepID=UPI0022BE3C41|nr:hypothetical protein [Aquidulcibacter sp.]
MTPTLAPLSNPSLLRLSRRAVLVGLPSLVSACATRQAAAAANMNPSDPLSGAALYADLEYYASHDSHRTGTPGDLARSDWIARELERAGHVVRRLPFGFERHDLTAHRLAVDGMKFAPLDAYPLWDPVPTGADGVSGPLRLAEAAGPGSIACLEVDGIGGLARLSANLTRLSDRGTRAVVAVTVTPSGELFGHGLRTPLPLPVMLVGSKHMEFLRAAAVRGAQTQLLIESTRTPDAQAYKVEGRLERGPRRIVVSTPTSAWFASAGERGPGVALFLGLARWMAGRAGESPVSATFIASSGHELYGAGKKSYLEDAAPSPTETLAWIHLGASIAVYGFERGPTGLRANGRRQLGTQLLTNDDRLLSLLQSRFAGVENLTPRRATTARGELALMFEAGYRAFGFEGAHAYFHAPNDLPFVTGPELLESVGRALQQCILALETEAR